MMSKTTIGAVCFLFGVAVTLVWTAHKAVEYVDQALKEGFDAGYISAIKDSKSIDEAMGDLQDMIDGLESEEKDISFDAEKVMKF